MLECLEGINSQEAFKAHRKSPTDIPSVIFDFPSITLHHRPWFPFLSCCCPSLSLPECPPPLSPLHSMTSRPSPYSRYPWSHFLLFSYFFSYFYSRKLGQQFWKTGTKVSQNCILIPENWDRKFPYFNSSFFGKLGQRYGKTGT